MASIVTLLEGGDAYVEKGDPAWEVVAQLRAAGYTNIVLPVQTILAGTVPEALVTDTNTLMLDIERESLQDVDCKHHWILASTANESGGWPGQCKFCGETKVHRAPNDITPTYKDWDRKMMMLARAKRSRAGREITEDWRVRMRDALWHAGKYAESYVPADYTTDDGKDE